MTIAGLAISFAAPFFLAAILAIAASDVSCRRIPNRYAGGLALGSLLLVIGGQMSMGAFAGALALALGLMLLGTWLFARGWIGGGDVKYLAAAILWFPPAEALWFLYLALTLGAFLALGILMLRTLVRRGHVTVAAAQRHFLDETLCVPYGVSISLAAAISFWQVWL